MATKKMSLANIQGKLTREEMKNIMAGSGDDGTCGSPCEGSCTFKDGSSGTCRSSQSGNCYCTGAS